MNGALNIRGRGVMVLHGDFKKDTVALSNLENAHVARLDLRCHVPFCYM